MPLQHDGEEVAAESNRVVAAIRQAQRDAKLEPTLPEVGEPDQTAAISAFAEAFARSVLDQLAQQPATKDASTDEDAGADPEAQS